LQAPEMPDSRSLLADALGNLEVTVVNKLSKHATTIGERTSMNYHDIIIEELRIQNSLRR
jgi:hypothetical protein